MQLPLTLLAADRCMIGHELFFCYHVSPVQSFGCPQPWQLLAQCFNDPTVRAVADGIGLSEGFVMRACQRKPTPGSVVCLLLSLCLLSTVTLDCCCHSARCRHSACRTQSLCPPLSLCLRVACALNLPTTITLLAGSSCSESAHHYHSACW
jgi:hypothetical protein